MRRPNAVQVILRHGRGSMQSVSATIVSRATTSPSTDQTRSRRFMQWRCSMPQRFISARFMRMHSSVLGRSVRLPDP